MRVLFVVPRYGREVVGGAENLIRGLATRGFGPGDEVEVATTCALDHETWRNVVPAGRTVEDGVTVHRFPVSPRDERSFGRLHHRLMTEGSLSYVEEQELMSCGVWSRELQDFIEDDGERYDWIAFAPYLLGTTYWGARAWPDRSILVPCIHDEPYAYLRCVREMVASCAGCMFNSVAEERLARRLFDVPAGGVVGLGFDPPSTPADPTFAERHGLRRYVVYAGRLERAKRVDVAVDYVCRYGRAHAPDLRLVLIGAGSYEPPPHAREIVRLGFLDEEEKRAALAGAVALIHPSELESFAIVLMEAWIEGTPALVAEGSEVMRQHVGESGGGLTFSDYRTFEKGLTQLLVSNGIGALGQKYAFREASWTLVRHRLQHVLSALKKPSFADRLGDCP